MLRSCSLLSTLFIVLAATSLRAANITWIGGSNQWSEGAPNNGNWSPADEPDPDDVAIFNSSNGVLLGSNNTVSGLMLSGDAGLMLNGYSLTVNGATTVSGVGTILSVDGETAMFTGQNVTVNSGANFFLDGGTVHLAIPGAPSALLAVNNGGLLSGNGTIIFDDIPAGPTTVISNAGTITASNPSSFPFIPPAAASLTIDAWSANVRIDLDGFADNGIVNVTRNQTLNVNIPLADAFNSKLNLGHDSAINIKNPWTFSGSGALSVDNGAVPGLPGIAAGVATIGGGTMNQTGGTITVEDEDGTLRFNAPLNMTGGNLVNHGLLIFNANSTIGAGANVTMPSDRSSLTVKADRNVQINQPSFKLDGGGTSANVLSIEKGGRLGLNLGPAGDPNLSGAINLQGGELNVLTNNNLWSIDGVLNVAASDATATISGGIVTFNAAEVTLQPGAHLAVTATNQWAPGTSIAMGVGAKLTLAHATFNGPASIEGPGSLTFSHGSSVQSHLTIGTETFDWDGGTAGNTHSIANGVVFTIETAAFDDDGDMDDNVLIAGNGASLIVNSQPKWTMEGTLTANSFAVGTATIGGSSTMALGSSGVMNVNGNTNLAARVAFENNSATHLAPTATLTLKGGTADSPNVISGGSINGAGALAMDAGQILRGHGVINSNIVNAAAGELLAVGGELKVNGAINDIGVLGTAGVDGVLNIANAWSTGVAVDVRLAGGELKGGLITVTNATGIRGKGQVSSRLVNNTLLQADGGTLVFATSGNDNDWDGLDNDGALSAINGSTLELRDNAQFNFFGTATANAGSRIRAKDFALNLATGSSLHLTESVFESQRGSTIRGEVVVASGAHSAVEVTPNYFLTLEDSAEVTLHGDLHLLNNNITIAAGALFAGAGALIIPNGSHLVAEADAEIDVLLEMGGAFRPAGFDAVGRVEVKDYQQSALGTLHIELAGASLNQFDRLLVNGTAEIAGKLNLDIDGGFIPSVGQTFSFITASNGVFGTFDTVDVSGMPAGLAFHVNYLANAVQLQVVNQTSYAADFDKDGDVDATDLAYWKGAFGLNQLGDANGDNRTDGSDFLIWQRQFGSGSALPASQSAAGAIPEPATGSLLLLASIALFAARRLRQ